MVAGLFCFRSWISANCNADVFIDLKKRSHQKHNSQKRTQGKQALTEHHRSAESKNNQTKPANEVKKTNLRQVPGAPSTESQVRKDARGEQLHSITTVETEVHDEGVAENNKEEKTIGSSIPNKVRKEYSRDVDSTRFRVIPDELKDSPALTKFVEPKFVDTKGDSIDEYDPVFSSNSDLLSVKSVADLKERMDFINRENGGIKHLVETLPKVTGKEQKNDSNSYKEDESRRRYAKHVVSLGMAQKGHAPATGIFVPIDEGMVKYTEPLHEHSSQDTSNSVAGVLEENPDGLGGGIATSLSVPFAMSNTRTLQSPIDEWR